MYHVFSCIVMLYFDTLSQDWIKKEHQPSCPCRGSRYCAVVVNIPKISANQITTNQVSHNEPLAFGTMSTTSNVNICHPRINFYLVWYHSIKVRCCHRQEMWECWTAFINDKLLNFFMQKQLNIFIFVPAFSQLADFTLTSLSLYRSACIGYFNI